MKHIIIPSIIVTAAMLYMIIRTRRERHTYEAMLFRLKQGDYPKTRCICGLWYDNRFAGKYCFECGSVIVERQMASFVGPDGILFDEQGQPIMNLIRKEQK